MKIGEAVDAMQRGGRVRRAGWNGKGMWLILVKGNAEDWVIYGRAAFGEPIIPEGELEEDGYLPWVGMRTADRKFVPWLCSQTDLLADDWELA